MTNHPKIEDLCKQAEETNCQMIEDFRRLAVESELNSIKDVANITINSLKQDEGDKALPLWIKNAALKERSFLEQNEKKVIRGILDNLLKLHQMGACHGCLDWTNVSVSSTTQVVLMNVDYSACTITNIEKDYIALGKILRKFSPLPKDLKHLVEHLDENRLWMEHPLYIFNAVCTWDYKQYYTVIQYLANRMRRERGERFSDFVETATKVCFPNGWRSRIGQSSVLHSMLQDTDTPDLLKFMRIVCAHPPSTPGQYPSPAQVMRVLNLTFLGFLSVLVELLVEKNLVMPGDPIDKKYIGRAQFVETESQERRFL